MCDLAGLDPKTRVIVTGSEFHLRPVDDDAMKAFETAFATATGLANFQVGRVAGAIAAANASLLVLVANAAERNLFDTPCADSSAWMHSNFTRAWAYALRFAYAASCTRVNAFVPQPDHAQEAGRLACALVRQGWRGDAEALLQSKEAQDLVVKARAEAERIFGRPDDPPLAPRWMLDGDTIGGPEPFVLNSEVRRVLLRFSRRRLKDYRRFPFATKWNPIMRADAMTFFYKALRLSVGPHGSPPAGVAHAWHLCGPNDFGDGRSDSLLWASFDLQDLCLGLRTEPSGGFAYVPSQIAEELARRGLA